MSDQVQEDTDLAAIAEASAARAGVSDRHWPAMANASIEDVLRAASEARAAAEAAGIEPEPERDVRLRQLAHVLDSLPRVMRDPSRAELESRIDPVLLQAVNAWTWKSGSMILAGRSRVGKTSATVHLVRRLCAFGAKHGGEAFELAKSIRWQECRELSAAARELGRGRGPVADVIHCQHARLLILDDLGANDDKETLDRVLDFRIKRAWPTITTTGLRAEGPGCTEELFGQHFNFRLLERGSHPGTIVERFEVES